MRRTHAAAFVGHAAFVHGHGLGETSEILSEPGAAQGAALGAALPRFQAAAQNGAARGGPERQRAGQEQPKGSSHKGTQHFQCPRPCPSSQYPCDPSHPQSRRSSRAKSTVAFF